MGVDDIPFEVRDDPHRSGRLVAIGELDATTATVLGDALADQASRVAGTVELDLGEVSFIDSSGLQSVTGALRDLRAAGRDLVVVAASRPVRRIFEVTGMQSVLAAAEPAASDD
jgi:anti-anti-sigma factor